MDKNRTKTISYKTLPHKGKNMHEHRYHGALERLRSPQRIALLEMDRVLELSLVDLAVTTTLDVGMGTGLFAQVFAEQGIQVTGIDPNPQMIEAARKFIPQGSFQQASAEELPFPAGAFDLVFFGHVLHETDDPLRALQEARRVTRQRAVILEWPYREDSEGPPLRERLQPETIQTLAQDAGFQSFQRTTLKHMEFYRLDI
ncbi:MAG: class I SAM-dependent methyltransferase [Desulfobacteraceae bacterium]|nr:MAG: class I SAM-dependent methyltransferase [Desulfobacteraceae bacterium]